MCLTDVYKCSKIVVCSFERMVTLMDEKKLVIAAKKYVGETAVVSARLPVDLIKEIDMICEKTGRTRNELIQLCVEFAVENIAVEE